MSDTQRDLAIEQLVALEREAERTLGDRPFTDIARDCLSIARGYLELALLPGEPLNINAVERELAEVGELIGDEMFSRRFLRKLRAAAAWARIHVVMTTAPQ